MNLRERYEAREKLLLASQAIRSCETKGRLVEEEKCDIRTDFQRDRDRILHSKAFRRLKQKTQVFIAPKGDHYRTRLTHTLEVAQIARSIARALMLNEDLTEAIALGHDLGHTPFGHSGEDVLNRVSKHGFKHNEQSLRIVDKLEKKGRGLNLTMEVRDGILNHKTSTKPATLEGQVVRLADKIAYINHDIDDAIRGKVLSEESLPKEALGVLGYGSTRRIDQMIRDIIKTSEDLDQVRMSEEYEEAMKELRNFMFRHVYIGSNAKEQEDKAKRLIKSLYDYYMEYSDHIPEEIGMLRQEDLSRIVCDYIAGMTDQYAYKKYCQLFLPRAWDIY